MNYFKSFRLVFVLIRCFSFTTVISDQLFIFHGLLSIAQIRSHPFISLIIFGFFKIITILGL
jgi:hypothetical protein